MIGALNKLPMAIIGMFFFNNPKNLGSITSIIVGGFPDLFTRIYLSFFKKKKEKKEKKKKFN